MNKEVILSPVIVVAMMGDMQKKVLEMRRNKRKKISVVQQLILMWFSINACVAAFVPYEIDPMMQQLAKSKRKRVGAL